MKRSKATQAGILKRYLEEKAGTRPWYAKIPIPLHARLAEIAAERGLTHVQLTESMARLLIEKDQEEKELLHDPSLPPS